MLNQFRPMAFSALKRTRRLISRSQSSSAGEKWDLLSAVSLERTPVITKELTDLEKKFQSILLSIEKEGSHKSDFELRMSEDARRQKLLKAGKLDIDLDTPEMIQTAQDFLDSSIEEKKKFTFASRKTKEETDSTSLSRALDRHLLFLLEEEIGGKKTWVLPQLVRRSPETLRQTAERVLAEKLGSSVTYRLFGNAPSGFYQYKYPRAVRGETVGAKIFFYKAQYLGGTVKLNKESKYCWATRSQLDVLPSEYRKSLQMFLVDEEP